MRIPPQVAITVCADADKLARHAADEFRDLLHRRPNPTVNYCVALSGGRVATPFFVHCAATLTQAALNNVHFFWADERCVPPDHEESNFGAANQLLLSPVAIPQPQIHRIHGEAEPGLAAKQAGEELNSIAAAQNGLPILDLVILGMGEDGHVASLFPGDPWTSKDAEPSFRPVIAPKPPPQRVTLGFTRIIEARHAWVLVAGKGKAEAIEKAFSLRDETPLGRVLRNRRSTRVFLTEDLAPRR